MASTYPNGGDANFDLEGTAARISEVCKSLGGSENNLSTPVSNWYRVAQIWGLVIDVSQRWQAPGAGAILGQVL